MISKSYSIDSQTDQAIKDFALQQRSSESWALRALIRLATQALKQKEIKDGHKE